MAIDRYEWLGRLAQRVPQEALVMATYIGAVSFEWAHHTNEHPRSAHLGQMGDVIGMAVGLAIALPHRPVWCLDGDGSVLMELGQLVVMGQESPPNLCVFVADNGVYESIGWSAEGQRRPTATSGRADLSAIAAACGVPCTSTVETVEELDAEIESVLSTPICRFVDVRTLPGSTVVPPRQTDGIEDKYRFVRYVERTEGKAILHRAEQDRQLMFETP